MAYLGKTFTLKTQEKFDEFLLSLGIPKDHLNAVMSENPSETLTKNGDTYTLKISEETMTFKSGVEFERSIIGKQVKITFVVDGDTIIETQKFGDGNSITFKKEYSADKLVVTATNNKWEGVATRIYS